jgi:hypothetical protein
MYALMLTYLLVAGSGAAPALTQPQKVGEFPSSEACQRAAKEVKAVRVGEDTATFHLL